MATRGALGGLNQACIDVVDILDASGMDVILIETVGVGQDEVVALRGPDAHDIVVELVVLARVLLELKCLKTPLMDHRSEGTEHLDTLTRHTMKKPCVAFYVPKGHVESVTVSKPVPKVQLPRKYGKRRLGTIPQFGPPHVLVRPRR